LIFNGTQPNLPSFKALNLGYNLSAIVDVDWRVQIVEQWILAASLIQRILELRPDLENWPQIIGKSKKKGGKNPLFKNLNVINKTCLKKVQ